MSPRLITVLGGTGFAGRAIVRELIESGHHVRLAARRPALPAWYDDGDPLSLVTTDIRDEASVSVALEGADGVVNAVSGYVETREATFQSIHVDGAARVARLARRAGLSQLVQISGIGASHDSPSAYVRARAAGEVALLEHFPKATILRPSVLFGPDDAFLASLQRLARLPLIPLFGRGQTRLQPLHVDDLARAVGRLFSSTPPAHRLFELGGPEVLSYREILERVMNAQGQRKPLLPVPFTLWRLLAALLGRLPNPPLTLDQVLLMQQDNVVNAEVGHFDDLGILPRALEETLTAVR
ncbi:complex I NDUFA9 subunit family protein [Halomonas sp. ML-15]|uniref:complex I NDUFA9 subunit family protein n=1 Tax=Halomonas sp. ML-15 TaxID=2773305 RepID=UPI0017473632|nr:complex I NDUFA9 subunit family protein [Halomonas sp. ML-15]MBD3896292.1 complex I NDUFA9 subunit family protein [Halomonas sp. ML-15]